MLQLLNTSKTDNLYEKQIDKLKTSNFGLPPSPPLSNAGGAGGGGSQINAFGILLTDQFPDVLQHYPPDQCRAILTLLKDTNNSSLVNKKGPLGYTALHWMCIKNEYELIELLVRECNADVNARANIGETPLFICIK